MKKAVLLLAVTLFLISYMGITAFSVTRPDSYHPANREDSHTLGRVVITLLIPEIREAVDDFYAPYLSVAPTTVAYLGNAGITELRESASHSRWRLVLEVEPYVGPHLSVGRDRLIFEIAADGTVSRTDFMHLVSFPLPESYDLILKKPLP